jgi:tRNA G18 (ribose-2'-O)-methylase SpoU
MLALADHRWYLPMSGMAQSFNLSVSGANFMIFLLNTWETYV